MKTICNAEGYCPVCGNEIEYGQLKLEDNKLFYEWECPHCKCCGEEHYKMEFEGHYNIISDEEILRIE